MKTAPRIAALASELRSRLHSLATRDTAAVRAMRREFSARLRGEEAATIVALALHLLEDQPGTLRFVAYELVQHHRLAFDNFRWRTC